MTPSAKNTFVASSGTLAIVQNQDVESTGSRDQGVTLFNAPQDRMQVRVPAQRRANHYATESTNMSSWRPLSSIAPAVAGKVMLGFGASIVTRGIYLHETRNKAVGGALLASGTVASVFGGILMATDGAKVHACRARVFGLLSVVGSVMIGSGLAIFEYGLLSRSTAARVGAICPLALGVSILVMSVANGFANSELVHGDLLHKSRHLLSHGALVCGIGVSIAWGLTRPVSFVNNWYRVDAPIIGEVLLVTSTFLVMLGFALPMSRERRFEARLGPSNSENEILCHASIQQ